MESASVDEYLEALWEIMSRGKLPARVKEVSEALGVAPPSAVQMLSKMNSRGLVRYGRGSGVRFTAEGRRKARALVRNHRLIEVLLVKVVGISPEEIEHVACSAEHHISERTADAICAFLGHPRTCPHGKEIPRGKCCP